jgi:lysophospholipase L1-like esterase
MAVMRISFIGDSLVAGTGDPDFLGWAGRVCKSARARGHDVTCYNLGIRGNTSADILRRWREEAEARTVAGQDCRLVFSFGVNDTKDIDGQRIVEAVQAIAQARMILMDAVGWQPVLMVGPPPIIDEVRNARIGELSGRLAHLCNKLGLPFFDSFAALYTNQPWLDAVLAGDRVHPVAQGYEVWAGLVDSWSAWRNWLP